MQYNAADPILQFKSAGESVLPGTMKITLYPF